jgi:hypothetical protein
LCLNHLRKHKQGQPNQQKTWRTRV